MKYKGIKAAAARTHIDTAVTDLAIILSGGKIETMAINKGGWLAVGDGEVVIYAEEPMTMRQIEAALDEKAERMEALKRRKYYIVSEEALGHITVRVSDTVGAGRTELLEIEANSYAEAVRKVSFSATGMGKTAVCGVKQDGEAYAEVIE